MSRSTWTVTCTGTVWSGALTSSNETITVTDPAWNTNTSATTGLTIDNTPPVTPATPGLQSVSDSGSSSSDNITSNTTPIIDVVCTEVPSTITLYSNKPSVGTVIGTHNCTGTGSASVTINSLSDDTHSISYTETDSVGNVSAPSAAVSITVDTVDPMLSASVSTSSWSTINNPTFTFGATDINSIDRYEIDYQNATGALTTLNPATSPVSLTLDPSESPHTVIIRAYDDAGNIDTVTLVFPPNITITAPTTISNTTINDTTFTVTSPSNSDISNVSASSGTVVCNGWTPNNTVGPFSSWVSCTLTGITSSGSVIINASDATGAGQNQQSYVIEATPPVITFDDNVLVGPVQSDAVAVSASDDNGIASLEYKLISNTTCNVTNYWVGAGTSFNSGDILFTQVDITQNGNYVCHQIMIQMQI